MTPGLRDRNTPFWQSRATGATLAGSATLWHEVGMSEPIRIDDRIVIDPGEIEERFIRASGPGGQNVNKVSTAVQLRFDIRRSPSLPEAVRARAERLAGSRLTRDGVLVLTAQRHRSQERNRQDALAALVDLLARAAVAPVRRRPTRPTFGSQLRRLEAKTQRSGLKQTRRIKPDAE